MASVSIKHSVGKSGHNSSDDVRAVRALLNKFMVPGSLGGPQLTLEGKVGTPTISAIRAFQAVYLGHNNPDGRVDPGGSTLSALNGPVTQPRKGDPGEKTVRSVYNTLGSGSIDKMLFSFDGMLFTPKSYFDVGQAMIDRKLQAYYDPSMGPNAEYFHKDGYMLLGFVQASSTFQKSVIVHEATHAICDRRGIPMPTYQGEAIGHFAQAFYYYLVTGQALQVGIGSVNKLLAHGANAAEWMRKNNTSVVTSVDVSILYDLATKIPSVQEGYGFYYNGW